MNVKSNENKQFFCFGSQISKLSVPPRDAETAGKGGDSVEDAFRLI